MLRLVYLVVVYGPPLGPDLAGMPEPPKVDPALDRRVDRAKAWLPGRDRLRYDRAGARLCLAGGGPVDCLIIGSGPAGSVLAHELRQGGRTVLLLDQGPLVVPGSVDTLSHPSLLNGGGLQACDDDSILFGSARAVGGGTTVNADLAFPPTDPVVARRIEGWREGGALGKGRFTAGDLARANAWVEQRIGTRPVREAEINANNRILWEGAEASGFKARLYRLNEYAPGASPSPASLKRSALGQLLTEALQDADDPLLLLPNTKALRLLRDPGDPGRVTGAEVEAQFPWDGQGTWADPLDLGIPAGSRYTIKARQVFLCAGTVGSPALLLRSGFSNPLIGRGIVGHISIPVAGVFDRVIDNTQGLSASVYCDHYAQSDGFYFEAMSAGPAYAALLMPGSVRQVFDFVRDFRHVGGFGVMLLDTPDPGNRITVDAQGEPHIHYGLGQADQARFRRGIAAAVRLLFKAGAKKVVIPSNTVHPAGTGQPEDVYLTDPGQANALEAAFDFTPNTAFLSSAHLQGSDKLGSAPSSSVVSDRLKVWGTRNLYVVDSSVFPTSVGANPMQTIYSFAKVFCDQWLAQHPGPALGAGGGPGMR